MPLQTIQNAPISLILHKFRLIFTQSHLKKVKGSINYSQRNDNSFVNQVYGIMSTCETHEQRYNVSQRWHFYSKKAIQKNRNGSKCMYPNWQQRIKFMISMKIGGVLREKVSIFLKSKIDDTFILSFDEKGTQNKCSSFYLSTFSFQFAIDLNLDTGFC